MDMQTIGDDACAMCGATIKGQARFACDEDSPDQGQGLCSHQCATAWEKREIERWSSIGKGVRLRKSNRGVALLFSRKIEEEFRCRPVI